MKKLVMFGGMDLRQVQGINLVIDHFVQGANFFNEIHFTKVYGGNQVIDVASVGKLPIGQDIGTSEYKTRRFIRTFLRIILPSSFLLFAYLKFYLNTIRPSKKSIKLYQKSKEQADYILFHGFYSAFLHYKNHNGKVREKCALIVHAPDDEMHQFFDQNPAFKGKIRSKILAHRDYVYEHIDKVVYISKKAYKKSIVSESKKCFIYNGIDDYSYCFPDVRHDLLNLICVGSMTGWKGQELIIEALALMEEEMITHFHLTLVGDGNKRKDLERLTQDKNLSDYVTFTGTRNDVPELLRNQDVFVMPSKDEGLSIATLEGIRAGLFMLLTDSGGNREVMGSHGGFIINRDPNDIKDKLCRIFNDHLVNKEQKEASRKHFLANFTTKKFISSYESMFLTL